MDPIAFCTQYARRPFRKWSVTPAEWEILHVQAQNRRNILEIGSYLYTSSLAFITAMQALPECILTSIDPVHRDMDLRDDALQRRWLRIIGYSEDVMPQLRPHAYDLIFVDGVHNTPAVMGDFQRGLKLLSEGGTIIFHDVNHWKIRKGLLEMYPEDRYEWHNSTTRSKGLAIWRM